MWLRPCITVLQSNGDCDSSSVLLVILYVIHGLKYSRFGHFFWWVLSLHYLHYCCKMSVMPVMVFQEMQVLFSPAAITRTASYKMILKKWPCRVWMKWPPSGPCEACCACQEMMLDRFILLWNAVLQSDG